MRTQVHGHRGSRGTHPENTIPAFQEALDAGADAIELDVHLTKDGHLVVYHDFEIGGVLISDLSLSTLKACRVAPNVGVPTLAELISWKMARAPKLILNIEIKRDASRPTRVPSAKLLAGAVIDLLKGSGLNKDSLVQSFDFEVVREARKLDPDVKLSCLFEAAMDFERETRQSGAQVASVHFPLITKMVAESCLKAGIEMLSWTVNEPTEWVRLMDLGVRGLITDYPRRLVNFLGQRNPSQATFRGN